VRDDILDETASFEDLGKTPQKDLKYLLSPDIFPVAADEKNREKGQSKDHGGKGHAEKHEEEGLNGPVKRHLPELIVCQEEKCDEKHGIGKMRRLRRKSAQAKKDSPLLHHRKHRFIIAEKQIVQAEKDVGMREIFNQKFYPAENHRGLAPFCAFIQQSLIILPSKAEINPIENREKDQILNQRFRDIGAESRKLQLGISEPVVIDQHIPRHHIFLKRPEL